MYWVDLQQFDSVDTLRAAFPDATSPLYTNFTPTQREVKRQKLERVQWNGNHDTFPAYKQAIESHMLQNDLAYFVHDLFLERYCIVQRDALWEFPYLEVSSKQILSDSKFLWGALTASCVVPAGEEILLKYWHTTDGIGVWADIVFDYEHGGNRDLCAVKFRKMLRAKYTPSYLGGLQQFVRTFRRAYAHLAKLCYHTPDKEKLETLLFQARHEDTKLLLALCRNECSTFDTASKWLEQVSIEDSYHAEVHATRCAHLATHTFPASEQLVEPEPDYFVHAATNGDSHGHHGGGGYCPSGPAPSGGHSGWYIPPHVWHLLTPEEQTRMRQLRADTSNDAFHRAQAPRLGNNAVTGGTPTTTTPANPAVLLDLSTPTRPPA